MTLPEKSPAIQRPDPETIVKEFNECEYARLLGMTTVESRPGYAKIRMEHPGKLNSNGVLHGGAIFSVADHAFGLAANLDGMRQVAISAHIQFLAPGTGILEASAERMFQNGNTSVYRVTVTDGDRTIAVFEGVGIRS